MGTNDFLDSLGGDWAEARAAERERVDDPFRYDTPGEVQLQFQHNNGDWARIEKDPEALRPVIDKHKQLLRTTDADIRLLRALSIIGGWSIDGMWDMLLAYLESQLIVARKRDNEVTAKGGTSFRVKHFREHGICSQEVWLELLRNWWVSKGDGRTWTPQVFPHVALTWDGLPDEAMVGPALVRWVIDREVSCISAIMNGVLQDSDASAYGASMYFFYVLEPV